MAVAGQALGARPWRSRVADPIFLGTLAAIAARVLVLIVFFFVFLLDHARPALSHQGVVSASCSPMTGTRRRRSTAAGRWWRGR